ncbi:type II toxin-antitoxin system RelB/DinJ family antitoxin [Clostridium sp. MCC353]|uniref:type II toxin-antitoxin system RelB/DinJ family antitoxin n=1 Tax=Clostridium sp. MCC353 TaxID=2592646 RepID=UPI001C0302F6|nr:type II toxin-antitoxin system RelB/DinJ family antitoxin [Clostridium sp. MCC353]MBT9774922.1 type II toxin-antitoxin system RelB/DinJ family antitoxin [Clostridium sp. MCC353]
MATSNITIRIDEELKKQADELFADLGFNMTTALTAFVKQAVREQRIPFIISRNVPNQETMQAIEEIQKLKKEPNKKTYSSFSELLEEVENEI